MTPTSIELWNDITFIEKRIHEQGRYKRELDKKKEDLSPERYHELNESCKFIFMKFSQRRYQLMPKFPMPYIDDSYIVIKKLPL